MKKFFKLKTKDSKPEFEAKGKWVWDDTVQDWFDTSAKMYYTELRKLNGFVDNGVKDSIMQEYEDFKSRLGTEKAKALDKYLNTYNNISYSDILYKKAEYDKFENWYSKGMKDAIIDRNKIEQIINSREFNFVKEDGNTQIYKFIGQNPYDKEYHYKELAKALPCNVGLALSGDILTVSYRDSAIKDYKSNVNRSSAFRIIEKLPNGYGVAQTYEDGLFYVFDKNGDVIDYPSYAFKTNAVEAAKRMKDNAMRDESYRVSYKNNQTGEILHKTGFRTPQEADNWVREQGKNIIAYKLLTYNDDIKAYETAKEYNKYVKDNVINDADNRIFELGNKRQVVFGTGNFVAMENGVVYDKGFLGGSKYNNGKGWNVDEYIEHLKSLGFKEVKDSAIKDATPITVESVIYREGDIAVLEYTYNGKKMWIVTSNYNGEKIYNGGGTIEFTKADAIQTAKDFATIHRLEKKYGTVEAHKRYVAGYKDGNPFEKGQAYYYARTGDKVDIGGEVFIINEDAGKIGYTDVIGLTNAKTGRTTQISKQDFIKEARLLKDASPIKLVGCKLEFVEGRHSTYGVRSTVSIDAMNKWLVTEDAKVRQEHNQGQGFGGYDKAYVDLIFEVNGQKYRVHGLRYDLGDGEERVKILSRDIDYCKNKLEKVLAGGSDYTIRKGDSAVKDGIFLNKLKEMSMAAIDYLKEAGKPSTILNILAALKIIDPDFVNDEKNRVGVKNFLELNFPVKPDNKNTDK